MTDAQIAATYSDHALAGIIRQLTASGEWRERLKAAIQEQSKRRNQQLQEDQKAHS
jgi:chemotaxis receptor (MCP) glutamine deamidase CheD